MTYEIFNKTDKESYVKSFNNNDSCKQWIINTLDLSKGWSFKQMQKIIIAKG